MTKYLYIKETPSGKLVNLKIVAPSSFRDELLRTLRNRKVPEKPYQICKIASSGTMIEVKNLYDETYSTLIFQEYAEQPESLLAARNDEYVLKLNIFNWYINKLVDGALAESAGKPVVQHRLDGMI